MSVGKCSSASVAITTVTTQLPWWQRIGWMSELGSGSSVQKEVMRGINNLVSFSSAGDNRDLSLVLQLLVCFTPIEEERFHIHFIIIKSSFKNEISLSARSLYIEEPHIIWLQHSSLIHSARLINPCRMWFIVSCPQSTNIWSVCSVMPHFEDLHNDLSSALHLGNTMRLSSVTSPPASVHFPACMHESTAH